MYLAKILCVLIYLGILKDQYMVEISQIGRNEREERTVWVPAGVVADREMNHREGRVKTQLSLPQSPRLDQTSKDYDARGVTDDVLKHNIIWKNVSWYKTVSSVQGIVTCNLLRVHVISPKKMCSRDTLPVPASGTREGSGLVLVI